ncbi:MAG: hypothetical protein K8I65_13195 [Thermoanaerobaculia bacterium]|nr:hypothetical protein [Thermoanaerobaculia bacterium]
MSAIEFTGGRGSRHSAEAMASLRRYVQLVERAQAGDRDADRTVSAGERVVRRLNIETARREMETAPDGRARLRAMRRLLDLVSEG